MSLLSQSDDQADESELDAHSLSWRNCWGKPVLSYAAFIMLGIAPQLLQNMIYAEAPLFALYAPEKKAIQAHIIASFMVANLVTLCYLVLQFFKHISDVLAMLIVIAVSVATAVVSAFFWSYSVKMGSVYVSVPLMVCSFVAGAAGNTSILIWFSFASRYKQIFVSALSSGFGLSGLVPSLLNFVQNTGADYPQTTRFGPTVWLLVTAFLIVIFFLSFCFILPQKDIEDPEHVRYTFEQTYRLLPGESMINEVNIRTKLSKKVSRIGECLVMMLILSFSTFFVPGAFPYMGETQNQLVWMNIIFLVVPTIGAFLAGIVRPYRRVRLLPWVFVTFQTILFGYLVLILLSKTRPYVYHALPLVFSVMVLFAICSGYNSTMVYLLLRQEEVVEAAMVQQAQRYAGFTYQLGGFLGVFANIGAVHGYLYYQAGQ